MMDRLDTLLLEIENEGCTCDLMNGWRCGIHRSIAELKQELEPDNE